MPPEHVRMYVEGHFGRVMKIFFVSPLARLVNVHTYMQGQNRPVSGSLESVWWMKKRFCYVLMHFALLNEP